MSSKDLYEGLLEKYPAEDPKKDPVLDRMGLLENALVSRLSTIEAKLDRLLRIASGQGK